MKAQCVISHEVAKGPGLFDRYESGAVYDVTPEQLKGDLFLELRESGRTAAEIAAAAETIPREGETAAETVAVPPAAAEERATKSGRSRHRTNEEV